VSHLRAELSSRGLEIKGLKPELIHRLQSAIDEEEFGLVGDTAAASEATSSADISEETKENAPSRSATTQGKGVINIGKTKEESLAGTITTAAETITRGSQNIEEDEKKCPSPSRKQVETSTVLEERCVVAPFVNLSILDMCATILSDIQS